MCESNDDILIVNTHGISRSSELFWLLLSSLIVFEVVADKSLKHWKNVLKSMISKWKKFTKVKDL